MVSESDAETFLMKLYFVALNLFCLLRSDSVSRVVCASQAGMLPIPPTLPTSPTLGRTAAVMRDADVQEIAQPCRPGPRRVGHRHAADHSRHRGTVVRRCQILFVFHRQIPLNKARTVEHPPSADKTAMATSWPVATRPSSSAMRRA